MRKVTYTLIVCAAIFLSCKKEKKKTNENNEPELTQYTAEDIKILLDSSYVQINSSWDSLIAQDDKKMADIKRLLDEVSYNNASDEVELNKMYTLYDSVVINRYSLDNLNDENIDIYDDLQNRLISKTNQLAESTPNIEGQPLAIELMSDIIEADGMVFSKRGDYDLIAKKINKSIKDYPALIKTLGEPYSNMRSYGTFAPDDGY